MSAAHFSNYSAEARCEDCDWESFTKNSHGLAALHQKKTGHTVHIEVYKSYTITESDSKWHQEWKKIHGK